MARSFGYDDEKTPITRTLALSQGADNIGLAGVLGWVLATRRSDTAVVLLAYVVTMAVVGAVSVHWTILVIQGGPALIALVAILA